MPRYTAGSTSQGTFSVDITPVSADGAALGTIALPWSDLRLASGAVIDVGNGEMTLTFAADTLTLAGGQLVLPVGGQAAPSISPVSSLTAGIWFTSDPVIYFGTNSTARFAVDGANARISTTWPLTFIGTGTTILDGEDSAIVQMGADAAAPVAQTFKGPDARAGTDTDAAGGNMTIAPGRSTGTAAGGVLYLSTSPKGATGTAANALVNRVQVDFEGIAGFSPQDAAATPIEPTAPLKCFAHNKSVADDGIVTLPAITTNAWGTCVAGDASVRTQFVVDASGTATLVNNTASVVANADTDTNLCIGTAATQEPLQIKNRLGGVRVLNIVVWYD